MNMISNHLLHSPGLSFRRRRTLMCIIGLIVFVAGFAPISARTGREALDYMNAISEPTQKIMADMWEYVRASAHSKNSAQVEGRRRALIGTVSAAHQQTIRRPLFEGDGAYRDSVAKFIQTMLLMLREDYAALVNMEEVAEQSYDAMEAYLLAKKKANEKLDEAAEELKKAEQAFADRNHIKLTYTESAIAKNLKKSAEVMDYYNRIYLIFFRSYKQEAYLIEALKKEDVSKLEQNREALLRTAKEGLKSLSKLDAYEGDDSVRRAGREYLEFAKTEADEKTQVFSDFFMRKEMMEKMKRSLDLKKPQERTKEEVDNFNAQVRAYNEAVARVNETNGELNRERSKLLDRWNRGAEAFIDSHVPR